MKIIADSNILARAMADDEPSQSPIAKAQLKGAEIVALTLPALCELAWVFLTGYKVGRNEFAEALRRLISADNVKVDQHAAEAGLAMIDARGDFADGIIAHEGLWLGGETFISFDQKAVPLLMGRRTGARVPD